MSLRIVIAVAAAAVLGALAAAPLHAAVPRPFATAVYPVPESEPADADLVYQRIRAAGASVVRITVVWAYVAPRRPAQPEEPSDPAYDWSQVDAEVQRARAKGLEPMVAILLAPEWAERMPNLAPQAGGFRDPDPVALAQFARAAALRYSGLRGLPRVRYWLVWNEPNLSITFVPQFAAGAPYSPLWYRETINRMSDAVHSVNPGNVVIAGATAPFRDLTASVVAVDPDWGPLSFMRHLFCLQGAPTAPCSEPLRFDVWSHHPYTSGGPLHTATLPNDVSLGDLPEMKALLNAAVAAGRIRSNGPLRFWVTEFSWDSSPPDPYGVPLALEARWVAEGIYRMWQNGVSLVTWFTLRDLPFPESFYQSGLYLRGPTVAQDQPKPALQAFRFPFVAFRSGKNVNVWGRTPTSKAALLTIERPYRGRWRSVGKVRADASGIFQLRLKNLKANLLRARMLSGEPSVPFSALPVPDASYPTFGLPGAPGFRRTS